jgi:hypothetical protein
LQSAVNLGCHAQVKTPPSLLLPERAGEVEWGVASNGLAAGVAANKVLFAPHTLSPTLVMVCSVKNVGDKRVRVLQVPACQNGQATLEVSVDGKERQPAVTVVTAPPPPPPASEYVDLAPGEMRTATLTLAPTQWLLPDAFEADVRFRYVNQQPEASLHPQHFGRAVPKPVVGKPPTEPSVTADSVTGLWTGDAASPAVHVKVAPIGDEPHPAPEAAGGRKRNWLQRLFGMK